MNTRLYPKVTAPYWPHLIDHLIAHALVSLVAGINGSHRPSCSFSSTICAHKDLRQLRRGYRMWVVCGSPDWFFKEATSTLWSFGMYQMWVGGLPHSLRIRLQCEGVENPDGAGNGAVCPGLRSRVHCRRRR